MKSESKGKAIGDVACLREQVICAPCIEEPQPDGAGPKGNKSSAGTPDKPSKSKKDGNRMVRNKGRK